MVKTRSNGRLEEESNNEETLAKYSKTKEENLDMTLVDAVDAILAKQTSSSSGTCAQERIESVPFQILYHSLKSQGFHLPKIYKSLRVVLEIVERDDVEGTRMMILYIHHHNQDSQEFVENVFTDKGVVDILTDNFVIWVADVSKEEGERIVEKKLEEELSMEMVELLRQYQVDNFPLLMVVAIVEGQHQVMKVFSGVKDIATLYQGLTETIITFNSMMKEKDWEEGQQEEEEQMEEKMPVKTKPLKTTEKHLAPVLIELQVGPCLHPVQFSPQQQLHDLLQYVASQTGLHVGQFSLVSAPGTDLTKLWDNITLQQVGMKEGTRARLRIVKK